MALNKNERRALEMAREIIAKGERGYICFALDTARCRGANVKAVKRLQAYIRRALDGYGCLENWQIGAKHLRPRSIVQKRADRLAWIDWMLDQPIIEE